MGYDTSIMKRTRYGNRYQQTIRHIAQPRLTDAEFHAREAKAMGDRAAWLLSLLTSNPVLVASAKIPIWQQAGMAARWAYRHATTATYMGVTS